MSEQTGRLYRYFCPSRRPDLGDVPCDAVAMTWFNGRPEVHIVHRACYGYVDYARPLNEADISKYNLLPDPRNPLPSDS